jgi:hypothetical protein
MKSNGLKEEHRRDFVGGSDARINSTLIATRRAARACRAPSTSHLLSRASPVTVLNHPANRGIVWHGQRPSLMRFQIGAHGARRSAPEGYCQPKTDCAVFARHRVGVEERDRQIFRRA